MDNKEKVLTYADLAPRYNNIGEWKPLVYTGDIDSVNKEVYEVVKDEYDKRIYGALFYIKTTSCKVIEFIVKSHFVIPTDFQQIGSQFGKLQIHKLNFNDYSNSDNIQIYDGTLELPGESVDDIKNGLYYIDTVLHRIAFGLDTKIEWFMKYPHHDDSPDRMMQLDNDDMDALKDYLVGKYPIEDSIVFDVAMSWYINGNNSNNVFIQFLSYCIAMESLADNLLAGKLRVSEVYGIKKEKKDSKDVAQCIKIKHDKVYDTDPKKFIEEAYFDCIGSINKKLRQAMEVVFGTDHEYINTFFSKVDKYKIYDLRSKLAHGSFTILDSDHLELIKKRLPELRHIAYEFIFRLSVGSLKEDKFKKIKSQFMISIGFDSPKGTGVALTLNIYPNKDWRIKPEWLF